ncbi:MAG: LPS export ABC transporter permease LptF [Pseudomonadota bacterium]|nr:LPS export ABC transporter permease LptF [Pseudomonadota bacterium]
MGTARTGRGGGLTIIERALLGESFRSFLNVLLVLCLIILGHTFVSLLDEVVGGGLPQSFLLPMLGLGMIELMVQLLPLALMLGIMLAFGRMYRDSEMVAIRASGIGYGRIYRTLMYLAVPVTLMLIVLSLYISPLSVQVADRFVFQAEHRPDIDSVAEGRFLEANDGDWVVFAVSRRRGDRSLQGVFVHNRDDDKVVIETALSAGQRVDPKTGEHLLVLRDGQRYEGSPGRGDYQVLSFDKHSIRIPPLAGSGLLDDLKAAPTVDLLQSDEPAKAAELQARLTIPASAMLLVLLAVPLSHATPRQGRFGKIVIAILIYILYANLNIFALSLIATGRWPGWVGTWWVQLLLAGLVVALLLRQYGWYWTSHRLVLRTPVP